MFRTLFLFVVLLSHSGLMWYQYCSQRVVWNFDNVGLYHAVPPVAELPGTFLSLAQYGLVVRWLSFDSFFHSPIVDFCRARATTLSWTLLTFMEHKPEVGNSNNCGVFPRIFPVTSREFNQYRVSISFQQTCSALSLYTASAKGLFCINTRRDCSMQDTLYNLKRPRGSESKRTHV